MTYASDRLKDNDTVVSDAVKQDGCALAYASARLRNDAAIVTAAVEQYGTALA